MDDRILTTLDYFSGQNGWYLTVSGQHVKSCKGKYRNVFLRFGRHAVLFPGTFSLRYSHSIVAGGFELMSKQTRFTPCTSLMIRVEIRASTS